MGAELDTAIHPHTGGLSSSLRDIVARLCVIALLLTGPSAVLHAESGARYAGDVWAMDVADGWRAVAREYEVLFVGGVESCAFQVSGRKRPTDITDAELLMVSSRVVPDAAGRSSVEFTHMKGLHITRVEDSTYFAYWFLRKGKTFLLATYICTDGDQSAEMEGVEAMVGSLDAI